MTTDGRGLTEALQRRADGLGHTHPLSLEDVQGKARGIRRRRTALSGLAAATVLGVTAPFALSLGGDVTTPDRTPPVASTGVEDGVLTTDVAATSDEPGVVYLDRGTAHLPDGRTIEVGKDLDRVAQLGDGLVATELATGELLFIDESGDVTRREPSTGELAVSEDGTVVAWATPDRRLMTQGTTGGPVEVPRPYELDPADTSLHPKVVLGSETCDLGAGPGCVVYYDVQSAGEGVSSFHATSKEISVPHPEFASISDVQEGIVSGLTQLREDASVCSGLTGSEGELAWETCDYALGDFSPDGRYVVALPSYGSGLGAPSVAIIDVETHEIVAEWRSDQESQSYLATPPTWDTDGTLLGQVWDGRWSLMRFAPDGGLTKVMDHGSRDDTAPPLILSEGS